MHDAQKVMLFLRGLAPCVMSMETERNHGETAAKGKLRKLLALPQEELSHLN